MTNASAHQVHQEARPMLFADCPFCLGPMPVDAVTGVADCAACAVRLELAWDPAPVPEAAAEPERVLAPAA